MKSLDGYPKLNDKVYVKSKDSIGIIEQICVKKWAGLIATIKFNDGSEKMLAVHHAVWNEKNKYWIN